MLNDKQFITYYHVLLQNKTKANVGAGTLVPIKTVCQKIKTVLRARVSLWGNS
jgi:hypothetical protein